LLLRRQTTAIPLDALEFISSVILEGDPGASDEILDRAGDKYFAWLAL
jgi:hypothetical protein